MINFGSHNRQCASTCNCYIQSKQNIHMFTSKPKVKGENSFYTKWTTGRLSTLLLILLTLSCHIHLFCSLLSVLPIHCTSKHSFPLLHVYEYQQSLSHTHTQRYILFPTYDLTHFLLHSPLLTGKKDGRNMEKTTLKPLVKGLLSRQHHLQCNTGLLIHHLLKTCNPCLERACTFPFPPFCLLKAHYRCKIQLTTVVFTVIPESIAGPGVIYLTNAKTKYIWILSQS